MSCKPKLLIWRIFIITLLYLLQGVILGFLSSISIYLASHKASWKQQGTYNWVFYPFSFKILWAPIIDSIYIRQFGRPLTWLIPIQLSIGVILLVLSFFLESAIANLQVNFLTIIFFFLCFLIASQDVAVDGWSIALFNNINPQWSSTSQMIGQMTGVFIGSSVLMIFESAKFTNQYIRNLLSLPHQSYGLFSLQQFTLFWGIIFIVVSMSMMMSLFYIELFKKEYDINMNEESHMKSRLFQTYLSVLKLFRKRCILQLGFILLTFHIGFAATVKMTDITLISYGITRDTLALVNMPLFLVYIIVPLIFSKTRRPLIWFSRGYILRLIICIILATYIFFTSKLLQTSYFYPILILLLCLNEAFVTTMSVSFVGFCAKISELSIAGTYMTLLVTLSNLGSSVSSSIVLYVANWLPKSHAYSIEVGICLILGLIWIAFTWRMIRHLNTLPIEEWYLKLPRTLPASVSNPHPTIIDGEHNVISSNV